MKSYRYLEVLPVHVNHAIVWGTLLKNGDS